MTISLQFASATALQDTYRLLSLFAGDNGILDIAEGHNRLACLRNEFLMAELARLLTSTAIANRIHDKHLNHAENFPAGKEPEVADPDCGTLWPDIMEPVEVPLTFREACNKIIHADHVSPDIVGDLAEHPLSPSIILRGQSEQNVWIAHLDVVEYVRATVTNLSNHHAQSTEEQKFTESRGLNERS